MKIATRGLALTIAALILASGALAAPVETVLYSFTGGSDGFEPVAGLIADNQGALYSTTESGGSSGGGTVFKLTPHGRGQTAWTETVLYSFTGGSDGAFPAAGLIADNLGALYGTTSGGGSSGRGTVFKLTPPGRGLTAWTETVLYSFTGGSDGSEPVAGLIADNGGALYGTTLFGGSSGGGTVFKVTPPGRGQTAWTETVLYSFKGGSDGATPEAGLIVDNASNLYGTTVGGGGNDRCANGCGTVFKLTRPGRGQTAWTETVLHSFTGGGFTGGSDGGLPLAGLIADTGGALYGTTFGGGTIGGGTVFKLTPPGRGQTAWTETVLYSFCSLPNCSDGEAPAAGLIADKQGVLYGTTLGGESSVGPVGMTVFKLTPPGRGQTAWTETVLYSFTGGSDGGDPRAGLIALARAREERDNGGALYGTTQSGGSGNNGTVFKVTLCPEPRRKDDHDGCPVFVSEE